MFNCNSRLPALRERNTNGQQSDPKY
ncbi:hypothetical protein FG05_35077 [Fusarium graminearum]|nr:hypothetical protein FG05_35077 [Fusarium graminearum]